MVKGWAHPTWAKGNCLFCSTLLDSINLKQTNKQKDYRRCLLFKTVYLG